MSSTSNVQNLLTNVFRPTFVYNTTTSNYQSKLELVNIDTISANAITAYAANVGDASCNVYVGVGAGNNYSVLASSSNTTDTFLGASAGGLTSNVKNSVFLGYRAGYGVNNSSNSISIGANTLNGGNSNIYIGCATGIATGSNNIFIGPGVSNGGTSVSNTLLIGSGSNTLFRGDLTSNRVGINTTTLTNPSNYITLDVNGYTRIGGSTNNGNLGINTLPGTYTLDVNGDMRVSDGWASLVMTHDSNSNASLGFSNVRSANCNATIQSTGGFFSSQGTAVASTIPQTIRSDVLPGSFMFSAESPDGSVYHHGLFQRRRAVYSVVSQASNATILGMSISAGLFLFSNASNLNWNTTFFPAVSIPPTLTIGPGTGVVTTLAGQTTAGSNDGTGAAASFNRPNAIAVIPSSGATVVAEASSNNRIRLITPGGVVTTLAGSGTAAFADGTGAGASFNVPSGVAVIPSNGVTVVADAFNHRIRLVTSAGVVTTLAGNSTPGSGNGTGAGAGFNFPRGVAVIPSTNVIVVGDTSNHRIRLVTYPGGVVTTLAGSGTATYADGTGTSASFNDPRGVAVLPDGNIVVADTLNNRIRLVTPTGVVTTLAGQTTAGSADGTGAAASFFYPWGVAVIQPSGLIVVVDRDNNRIRLVTYPGGVVTTLAGSSGGFAEGTGAGAQFSVPQGVAVDPFTDRVYVADSFNNRVRQITLQYS
jgi:sugar lactone lactonase YvrE